jgi:uncharacterized protein YqhQ
MSKLKILGRLAAATQLLPAMEGGEELLVGGQAVIEGIMMRSPHSYCISVRKPSGEIAMRRQTIQRPSEKHKFFKWPLLRGLGTLGQALTLGVISLKFSTDIMLQSEMEAQAKAAPKPTTESGTESAGKPAAKSNGEIPTWLMAGNILLSVGFFIGFYKLLPLLLTTALQKYFPVVANHYVFNLVDGVIRITLFLAFLYLLSRWQDMHRIFEYHGAEHKTVFNFESGKDVNVANARQFITLHPRCGTSFMLVIMLLAIPIYTLIPFDGFVARLVTRVVMLPLIVGLSYELIRFAARRQGTLWSYLVAPGLWLQKITTQEPSDDQLEIAIHALDQAMELEKEHGGELVIA